MSVAPRILSRSIFVALFLFAFCGASKTSWSYGPREDETKPAKLIWGGDETGGAPFIFGKESNPKELTGFEFELAQALGRELGRDAEFRHCEWASMLKDLTRGDIEIALNGYELTPERSSEYLPSLPYFVYRLGLYANKNNQTLTSWDDLKKPKAGGGKHLIGILTGSAAERYIRENFAETCETKSWDGVTDAFVQVESGQLDATVQDTPVGLYYLKQTNAFPKMKQIGEPVAPGYYVVYAEKSKSELIAKINTAIQNLFKSGELKKIYSKYGVWDATQETLPTVWADLRKAGGAEDAKNPPKERTTGERWAKVRELLPIFIDAAIITVELSVISMPIAMILGLLISIGRLQGGNTALPDLIPGGRLVQRIIRFPLALYVEVIRGTPLIFQLFVIYYFLPRILGGARIDAFWSAIIALAINYSAYESEIFRLGLQAIPKGQLEAALSLGMTPVQATRRIILPQAFRIVIPASANDFIALFKDTAACSVISVVELSKCYQSWSTSTLLYAELAILVSVLYLLMSYPLSLLAQWLERRLSANRSI